MIHYQKEIGFNFCSSSGNILHVVYLFTEHRVYFVRLYLLNKQEYFNENKMSTNYSKGLNVYKISRLLLVNFFFLNYAQSLDTISPLIPYNPP